MPLSSAPRLRIAVIGSGVSGLAAAWLLSRRHTVTLFEQDGRIGGHCNTVTVETRGQPLAVDIGFIVFNHLTYPNLTALFQHLGVATEPSDMSFAVSRAGGKFEYAGHGFTELLAQPTNALRPRFWRMLSDTWRFYRHAPAQLTGVEPTMTLGGFLERYRYGANFRDDHLLPMAAAIWSAPVADVSAMPAHAFIRFFDNHGLLKLHGRPQWHTVVAGSKSYVARLSQAFTGQIRARTRIGRVTRNLSGVTLADSQGNTESFDHAVIATHADQALAMLADADAAEHRLLGAFRYTRNRAVLHSDPAFMPRRRAAWSSWNYVETHAGAQVTYWMNRLQPWLDGASLFVTLNPMSNPAQIIIEETYAHPVLDLPAMAAQRELWSLQGRRHTWFCGAYFGAGFHEDGLQAGLAVAEDLGGERRPWTVDAESGRIVRTRIAQPTMLPLAS
jgi:predicted NAD/FAD-binding protein